MERPATIEFATLPMFVRLELLLSLQGAWQIAIFLILHDLRFGKDPFVTVENSVTMMIDDVSSRRLDELSRLTHQTIAEHVNALSNVVSHTHAIDQAIQGIDLEYLANLIDLSRRYHEERRTEEAFRFADLFPSPSIAAVLTDRVVVAFEEGQSKEQIEQLVMDHFDAEHSARVDAIVEKLLESPDFATREGVLRDVLTAHHQGLDQITAFPLVAMIEGVLLEGVRPFVSNREQDLRQNKIRILLEEMPASVQIGNAAFSCLIGYIQATLFAPAWWRDDDEDRHNYRDQNRHRLLHGMAVQGTRINTLRCFLILEMISIMFAGLRLSFADSHGEDIDDNG